MSAQDVWRPYRKKPVVVHARGPLTVAEEIHTLEGVMRADVGDYVVRGVTGEMYPIKASIFRETYQVVDAEGADTECGQ